MNNVLSSELSDGCKGFLLALRDNDPIIRDIAAHSLNKHFRDYDLTNELITIIKDKPSRAAFDVLKRTIPAGIHAIGDFIKSPDARTRQLAADTLNDIMHEDVIPYLLSCLSDEDPEIRILSAQGLLNLANEGVLNNGTDLDILYQQNENDESIGEIIKSILYTLHDTQESPKEIEERSFFGLKFPPKNQNVTAGP